MENSSFNSESIQKEIMKQKGVSSSQYHQNKNSLNSTIQNQNEGSKHGSYQRYLDKKKGKVISNQGKTIASTPQYGNKTNSMSLTSYAIENCSTMMCPEK
tara:strand:- start:322 stop:621 length:300 start_codon:yes stop_codon:yes gene_type:complete